MYTKLLRYICFETYVYNIYDEKKNPAEAQNRYKRIARIVSEHCKFISQWFRSYFIIVTWALISGQDYALSDTQ